MHSHLFFYHRCFAFAFLFYAVSYGEILSELVIFEEVIGNGTLWKFHLKQVLYKERNVKPNRTLLVRQFLMLDDD